MSEDLGEFPKCLVKPYHDHRPLIEYQILQLMSELGIKKITLLAGHYSEALVDYFKKRDFAQDIQIIVENSELGTGGAIRNFLINRMDPCKGIIVVNGDTVFTFKKGRDFFHFEGTTIFATDVFDESNDFGLISVERNGQINEFLEKERPKIARNHGVRHLVSAGVYFIHPDTFDEVLTGPKTFSLEKELWPRLVERRKLTAIPLIENFFDIGTPNRLSSFLEKGYEVLGEEQ